MLKWIIKFLYGGGDDMMAMLWAQQIKEILEDSGMGELVTE